MVVLKGKDATADASVSGKYSHSLPKVWFVNTPTPFVHSLLSSSIAGATHESSYYLLLRY